jgi:hypothetical protein
MRSLNAWIEVDGLQNEALNFFFSCYYLVGGISASFTKYILIRCDKQIQLVSTGIYYHTYTV